MKKPTPAERKLLHSDTADIDPAENWPFTLDDVFDGRAMIGNYRINGYIGKGGMATVFKAFHQGQVEQLALKLLHGKVTDDEVMLNRFIQEFTIIERIEHPNIIKVYGQGFSNAHAYIVMEYLPHGNLKKKIRYGIDSELAITYAVQIASALAELHQFDVLHRDLKPENVLFRNDNTAVLADFGIAKSLSRKATGATLTKTGMVIGTLSYASPEQILAVKNLTHQSDQYSLGLILYEMLVGKSAFSGKTPVEVAIKHVEERPPELPEKLSHIQPIMNRLLAKRAMDRYTTSNELVETLQNI